jgi:hypothetical protein
MGIFLPTLMWAIFLGIITTNEVMPHKLVRVIRFDFDLPPQKGKVFFEAYNIINKKSSDQLQKKLNMHEGKHSERSAANNELYVPEKLNGSGYFES